MHTSMEIQEQSKKKHKPHIFVVTCNNHSKNQMSVDLMKIKDNIYNHIYIYIYICPLVRMCSMSAQDFETYMNKYTFYTCEKLKVINLRNLLFTLACNKVDI